MKSIAATHVLIFPVTGKQTMGIHCGDLFRYEQCLTLFLSQREIAHDIIDGEICLVNVGNEGWNPCAPPRPSDSSYEWIRLEMGSKTYRIQGGSDQDGELYPSALYGFDLSNNEFTPYHGKLIRILSDAKLDVVQVGVLPEEYQMENFRLHIIEEDGILYLEYRDIRQY